jgi:signal transduction histidine kinase/CheY-like chemotaxis protein
VFEVTMSTAAMGLAATSSKSLGAKLPFPAGLWRPLLLFVLGSLAIALLLITEQAHHQRDQLNMENIQLVAWLRSEVALAGLSLENYVQGKAEASTESISKHLEAAQDALGALDIESKANGEVASGLKDLLEAFRNLALERQQGFEKRLPVELCLAIKIQYQEAFEDLVARTVEVEAGLVEGATRHRSRFRLSFWGIVAGLSALILGAAVALVGRETQHRRQELELEKRDGRFFELQKMDSVGRLACGLAHDISNYLAAIRGHSELVLLRPPSPERLRHKMEAVVRTVGKATDLLDRLLAFSRHHSPDPQAVQLNALIIEMGKMIQPSLGENIELEFQISDDLWWVKIDQTQMEQVVVNLLMNARSAMPHGGIICLRTVNQPASGEVDDMVCLTVSDQGCGIPKDVQEKIFEPFWTTRKDRGGSGLGLAVVCGVVQQSGGFVVVRSQPGEGASFEISLPRCEAGRALAEEDFEGREKLGGDATLMLVDDNEEFLSATAALLEGLGYQVATAPNAPRALELFRDLDHDVDLVLVDLVMPGMDGCELVERLRQVKADLQVLFLSGHDEEVIRTFGQKVGDLSLPKGQLTAAGLDGALRRALAGGASSSVHVGGSKLGSRKKVGA